MKIRYYPDPILVAPTEAITEFNDALKTLVSDMTTTMLKAKGIGLAAPQVGLSKKLFIMQDKKGIVHTFINPKIIDATGESIIKEGCLSAPGIHLPIARPQAIVVEYQDIDGTPKKIMAEGIEARCIQHECEHLNGDFYFNRVNRATRKAAISQLKKLLK